MEWLAQPAHDAFIGPNRPVPLQRRPFIGLRQERRLHRCTPRQGTYLGFVPTPRIHPHLTQRASRDLISTSLALVFCPCGFAHLLCAPPWPSPALPCPSWRPSLPRLARAAHP